ncbi:Lactosylceramide 4-alpha-galactosyltransferase-like 7 [Homarus americanus]|uniref:Lactosylceramide 4-alpha-galactosyltransferase-like 7 n=1 Tax=Homarus americanus TaxID=6706 RepID=A0A8J5JZN2_HOMAM|nr:Lactosylceramide 4-alpha-galactosyltransferase-like 7 [Homarus americanus]
MWEVASNIFLVESSCNPQPSYRAWCAVESLSRQNPDAHIWYVITSPMISDGDGLVSRLRRRYRNLQLVTIDQQQLFSNTPLMDVYTAGLWLTNSTWPAVNLSDLLRLALVWHTGGFYADSDFICLANVTTFKNVIGVESVFYNPLVHIALPNSNGYDSLAANGAFHLTRHHPLLHKLMTFLSKNFEAMTKVLKTRCGYHLRVGEECVGVTLLPTSVFYPVAFSDWKRLFQPAPYLHVSKMFPQSALLHAWNKVSHQKPITPGSFYDAIAATYCPVTHRLATKLSQFY